MLALIIAEAHATCYTARQELLASLLISDHFHECLADRISPDSDFDSKMTVLEIVWNLSLSGTSSAFSFLGDTGLVI